MTIEIQLDNEDYRCIIQKSEIQPSFTIKPVKEKKMLPSLSVNENETPPPLPPKPYRNVMYKTMDQDDCKKIVFTPPPVLPRRTSKPSLRSKVNLMAEEEKWNLYNKMRSHSITTADRSVYNSCLYLEIKNERENFTI